jgi:hypothetical protein
MYGSNIRHFALFIICFIKAVGLCSLFHLFFVIFVSLYCSGKHLTYLIASLLHPFYGLKGIMGHVVTQQRDNCNMQHTTWVISFILGVQTVSHTISVDKGETHFTLWVNSVSVSQQKWSLWRHVPVSLCMSTLRSSGTISIFSWNSVWIPWHQRRICLRFSNSFKLTKPIWHPRIF